MPADGPVALVVRAQVLASLAYAEAEQGRVDLGLRLLEQAGELVATGGDPEIRGLLHLQRGSILVRQGQSMAAIADLDEAVRLFAGNPEYECRALLNRSALHLYSGNANGARADLRRCTAIATSHRLPALNAKARTNLSYLSYLTGDLPAALRDSDAALSDPALRTSPFRAIFLGGRAEALRAAGLTREADADLAEAIEILRKAKLTHDLAEAQLARAEVALLDGRPDIARRVAGQARRGFLRRGNETRAQLAELLVLQARLRQGQRMADVAGAAGQLSERLAAAGLEEDGRVAALVAARALLATRRLAEAAAFMELASRLRPADRIGTRLLTRLVRAELAGARGDRRTRSAQLRGGLVELHRYQSRFGSLDLQTASVVHGRELAELGLADALAGGRPAEVFAWAERSRALAARLPPVRPPQDAAGADLLAQLRGVRSMLRASELAGRPDPELRRRRLTLERQIRQRAWFAAGPGEVRPDRPASLAAARAALAEQSGCLIAYLSVRGDLHALVVTARAARVIRLGPLAPLRGVLHRVRADLDVLALSMVPVPVREVVRKSLHNGLRRLDDGLWRPITGLTGNGPVVVVPTSPLGAVPWTALPGPTGRPVVVVPSVTWWLTARAHAGDRVGGRPVFAVGPGVQRGESEVRSAATVWPGATVLTGSEATSTAVLAAAAGSPLLHVAAHGVHEPDNPLFSAIELADGPLFGYDLPAPAQLPTHVVLSACDLGLAEVRPGDEALGMTSALLRGGVVSTVAGVARVGDEVANPVMVAHHRAQAAGRSPAAALAEALTTAGTKEPVPLVCFGAGW
ncbi:MAG TPA: CHAT domain-containing protein [Pseudonocardiaceae bacterium]|nr:CHAT domain-containing protein [Pseudonocardiaceae bacterium]